MRRADRVVERMSALSDHADELLVRLHRLARKELLTAVRRERRQDAAREPRALDEYLEIARIR